MYYLISYTHPGGRFYDYAHFTEEETEELTDYEGGLKYG